jgi:pSer/pThr/pTyr-binding forkhead associated (FHA) protein
MELLIAGTFVGAGSFRCQGCGYVLTLAGLDTLAACPRCDGRDYTRASLFNTGRTAAGQETVRHGAMLSEPPPAEREAQMSRARELITQPGEYLCYEDGGDMQTIGLSREWTRIGRSLAADLRFDDPTVSRRHALIVRQADGVRVLDDRSMNGVFVNGKRVQGKELRDGDEIIIGRYRLSFLSVTPEFVGDTPTPSALGSTS